jgi:hypothetical protein
MFSPDETRIPSQYYLRSKIDLDELTPVFPRQDWGKFKTGDERVDAPDQRTIARVVAAPPARLWIVRNAAPDVEQPNLRPLRGVYRLVNDRTYDGRVEVMLFARR